jgi:DNA-binding MarR family transcriptional regulator
MNEKASDVHLKTVRVLDVLAQHPNLSQRELAQRAGISLGLANLIIKRLNQTGHIKIANITARKVEYILTPKGLQEKSSRSIQYLLKTIRTFQTIHQRVDQLVQRLVQEGHTQFALQGLSEVADLFELSFKKIKGANVHYRRLADGEIPEAEELVLDCRIDGTSGPWGVSVLNDLLALTERTAITESILT